MLKIQTLDCEIAATQRAFRMMGTRGGIRMAAHLWSFHRAMERLVTRFMERQERSARMGRKPIPDGQPDTLTGRLFGPLAREGYPRRGSAALQGLRRSSIHPLPFDSGGYLFHLDDGPPQQREFGGMSCLGVYMHETRTMTLLWMGAEADLEAVNDRLRSATGGYRHWHDLLACGHVGWSLPHTS